MLQPDLRCYHHPEREATSQCDRCGDYLCAQCVKEWAGQHLCGKCFKHSIRHMSPREGWKACVMNLVGVVAFAPLLILLEAGLHLREIGPWVFAFVLVPLFGWAGIRARGARGPLRDGARELLTSIAFTSLAGVAGTVSLAGSFLLTRWGGPSGLGKELGALLMFAGMGTCLVLLVISFVRWGRAVRRGVAPTSAVVVSFLSTLVGLLVSGLFVAFYILMAFFFVM